MTMMLMWMIDMECYALVLVRKLSSLILFYYYYDTCGSLVTLCATTNETILEPVVPGSTRSNQHRGACGVGHFATATTTSS